MYFFVCLFLIQFIDLIHSAASLNSDDSITERAVFLDMGCGRGKRGGGSCICPSLYEDPVMSGHCLASGDSWIKTGISSCTQNLFPKSTFLGAQNRIMFSWQL